MKKSVLITGASGFIGSRLVVRCAESGWNVIATARTALPDQQAAPGVPLHTLDVLDPSVPDLEIEADALIHCATANDIVSRDFAAGVNLSVNGTRNILELAVKRRIPRVIFFSTLQVYGTELEGDITEATPPHCETAYGLNHLLGEEVCRLYANKHGLDIALVRPANVYGVPDAATVNRSTLVPMCFVKEALASGRLVLKSSGRQQRNFVSTDEVADFCLHLLTRFPKGVRVVNVGSRWLAGVREIAEMVAAGFKARTGRDMPLEITSDQPERGNRFVLHSQLGPQQPAPEQSRLRMASVISRLFDHFQS